MKRFLTNNTAALLSVGIIMIYLIGYLLFGADKPRIVFGSLLIGALSVVMIILFRPALDAFRRRVQNGGDNMIISQWGVYSLLFLYFAWVQISTSLRIQSSDPEATSVFLRDLPVGGLFTTLFFIVTGYTILAPINTTETIEKVSLRNWFIAVIVGTMIASVLATLSFLRIVSYF